MYLSSNLFLLILINLINLHFSSSSICSDYYSSQSSYQQCECEDLSINGQSTISLKCTGQTNFPNFLSTINYQSIEIESCLEDLNFELKPFYDLTLNTLRIRHCNLININDQSFINIKQFEKFYLENSTIKSILTSNENFQDIFISDSFQTLKSLTLKNIHYHQINKHDKKLNLELLLQQLPRLYRLELINIYLDNYRYHDINSIGEYLTYLSLTNTHQTSLLPIEYLKSLQRLLIRHLPDIFHSQPLIASLGKLKNLKYILFEHNQLKTIENLHSNTIDDIDLSSNLIESIDEYTFEYVPKLRQLTLSGNPLNSIDKNAFCGIENLQRLSIHIKHTQISPLDNCLLINYPQLQIIQDSQIKLQCNCQLMNVFQLKRQQINANINRIFKLNQMCLFKNDTSSYKQQDVGIHLYELENYLNCSNINLCNNDHLCQERKIKILKTEILSPPPIQVNPKLSSFSTSLYSFFSYLLFPLLLCFLYL
ncbi:unnamed protein product [Adineta steineri]|uniref:Leucine rich repeat protein n=1 Tax=Adineta steineri TaxID=433720 RepID=A0A818RG81_9BILA|nr:unnamed protein product [Adineta steineri]CAF3653699.1 unnamed protein product [Adineta steineri]